MHPSISHPINNINNNKQTLSRTLFQLVSFQFGYYELHSHKTLKCPRRPAVVCAQLSTRRGGVPTAASEFARRFLWFPPRHDREE